jgi:hypothetical protein
MSRLDNILFSQSCVIMSSSKTRKSFSIKEKTSIIKEFESGKKQAVICKERHLASSTLATILKNRDKIMCATSEFSSKVKKLRYAKNDNLDKAVLTWFRVNRESNVPISGAILKEKAEQFSEKNGNSPELKWSNGWLNRFKSRHNIHCGKILLLIDNCSVHPQIKNLQNIQLEFLPPNATSVLQPRSLKSHYRKLLVKRLMQDLEEKKEVQLVFRML